MHPRTPDIASNVRRAEDLAAQLDALRGGYTGQPCVLLTCGPSLGAVPPERLRASLTGVLTIVVKQAIDVAGPEADFLCFNSFNVRRYAVPSPSTIRVFSQEPTGRLPQHNRFDVRFLQARTSGDLSESVAARRDFADHPLVAGSPRPWGPGILYEVGLHLVEMLECSELITIGWDVANDRGNNVHFDDDVTQRSFFDAGRANAYSMTGVRRRLPRPVVNVARHARALGAHATGKTYNRVATAANEAGVVAASTGAAAKWLATTGTTLRVVSPSPHLDPSIERLEIAELWDVLARYRAT